MKNLTKTQVKKLEKKTIKNILFGGLTGLITKIGALIFTIFLARSFLPELFGTYSLVLTIVLTLMIFTDLGLGETSARYISESLGKKDKREAHSRFLFLFKSKLTITILSSLILFLGAGIISNFFGKPELVPLLRIGSLYLFINGFYSILSATSLAVQRIEYSTAGETTFQIARLGLLFLAVLFYKSLESVFGVLIIALSLASLVVLFLLSKNYPFLFIGKKIPVERKKMFKFSGFLALSSFTLIIFTNIDKIFLGYFLELKFLGFYTSIFTLIGGVLGLLGFVGVMLPVFTQLKGDDLKTAFRKTFHYVSIIAFPCSIGLAFIALPALKLLYGDAYVPAEYSFAILMTAIFLSLLILEASFSGIYRMLLNSQEHPKIPMLTNLSASIVNIILNIVLIVSLIKINPSYGLIGVATATFLSRYGALMAIMIITKKRVGISPSKQSILKPLFASLVMLGYLFIFDYFVQLTILSGLIMIITAAIIYFLTIFLIKAVTISEVREIIKIC